MKNHSKIVLLVVVALLLTLTACTLKASTPPAPKPTSTGEVPFPVSTIGDVGTFGTQTAIAQTPVATQAPQVSVATETQAVPQPSGQEATAAAPAAATAAPVVNTPEVVRPTNYVLQKGEWPICVARRYNLDLNTFFSSNGLNMNSKPAAGTNLKVPTSGNWNTTYGARALKQHPADYTVVAGDTVYSIACRYGDVAPESILAVNGLANASDIKAGMKIKIP